MGGVDPTSTFSLLGNGDRLRIVLALGDAGGPGKFGTLPFSELQSRVGIEDNGNFNYHLAQLRGSFVDRTDGGYRLTLTGVYVYRALRASPLTETPECDRLETDVPCPTCGVAKEVWSVEHRCLLGCPDCGTVYYRYPLPAGGRNRTDGPTLAGALRERTVHDANAMIRGFCPYCSGPVDCDPGTDPGVLPGAPEDRSTDEPVTTLACEHCRWFLHTNAAGMLEGHPRVNAFLLDHGIDSHRQDPWREAEFAVDVRSERPWQAHVRVYCDDVALSLELDGDLDVVEAERGDGPAARRDREDGGTDDRRRGPAVTGRWSGV